VAMAFEYFAENEVDIAVIETGLGGRLDSTNVIKPLLSVITNIGFDHVNILGDTLPAIASEKAGIIKFNTPVVIGETLPDTLPVFIAKAKEQQADLQLAVDKYSVRHIENKGAFLVCEITDNIYQKTEKYELGLAGTYQSKNLCTVLTVIDTLNNLKFNITQPVIHKALRNVKKLTGLTGRWDVISSNPAVILDVGHNEDGIRQVLQQLHSNYPDSKFHFVLGFVNDKDITNILALFPANAQYYFTNAHIPRALPFKELQKLAAYRSLSGNGFDDVNDAIKSAIDQAEKKDVIMVCGSFFIIAEVEDK